MLVSRYGYSEGHGSAPSGRAAPRNERRPDTLAACPEDFLSRLRGSTDRASPRNCANWRNGLRGKKKKSPSPASPGEPASATAFAHCCSTPARKTLRLAPNLG